MKDCLGIKSFEPNEMGNVRIQRVEWLNPLGVFICDTRLQD